MIMATWIFFAFTSTLAGSSCGGCGENSPIFGAELNLDGVPNEHPNQYKITEAFHRSFGEIPLPNLQLLDHELLAIPLGSSSLIEGTGLIGLVLKISDNSGDEFEVELIEFSANDPEIQFWGIHTQNHEKIELGPVPSYKFNTTNLGTGDTNLLCPKPNEDHMDQLALFNKKTVSCRNVENDGVLTPWCSADSGSTDYHAVLFSGGDRYEATDKTINPDPRRRWMNIGCKGSAGYKMHLSGHTSAATRVLEARGFSPPEHISYEQKQTMLNAITGKYCEAAKSFTVPGQQLFFDSSRFRYGLPEFSAHSHQAGVYEAIWNSKGIQCIHHPRRSQARLHDASSENLLAEILAACPQVKRCQEDLGLDLSAEHDGLSTSTTPYVITFVPESCIVVHEDGSRSCTDPDKVFGCFCDDACENRGDCCHDYDKAICTSKS